MADPRRIYGNHLPDNAPEGLRVTVDQLRRADDNGVIPPAAPPPSGATGEPRTCQDCGHVVGAHHSGKCNANLYNGLPPCACKEFVGGSPTVTAQPLTMTAEREAADRRKVALPPPSTSASGQKIRGALRRAFAEIDALRSLKESWRETAHINQREVSALRAELGRLRAGGDGAAEREMLEWIREEFRQWPSGPMILHPDAPEVVALLAAARASDSPQEQQ